MSDIFSNIYKPDVLSCLADLSNDEVFTPPNVVNQMLDMLPQELFESPDTTFLDPACKSGVFLREIAKRLIKGLENAIPDLQERLDHIFHKQLFAIAITGLTSLLSRRSVYCSKYPNSKYSVSKFDDIQGNILFRNVQHEWVKGKCCFCGASEAEYGKEKREDLETHAYEFIHTTRPQEIFNMKFDVIISNPPYQLKTAGENNGAQARPIYHHFVETALKLKPTYMVMITPSRWLTGGWNLDEYRDFLLDSQKIEELHDYPNASDCFPGVEIKGGVSFFKWSNHYHGSCKYVIHNSKEIVSIENRPLRLEGMDTAIRYNGATQIISKIRKMNEQSFSNIVSSMKPFGLPTKFKGNTVRDAYHNVTVYANQNIYYENSSIILKNREWISKYKIIVPKAIGIGDPQVDRLKPIISEPNSCCTETYIVIGPFTNEVECKNVLSYINTKFFHFMLTLHKDTQDCLQKTYLYVPMQDFSKSWTDEELYAKYNLTQEEIDFIESMIRPME